MNLNGKRRPNSPECRRWAPVLAFVSLLGLNACRLFLNAQYDLDPMAPASTALHPPKLDQGTACETQDAGPMQQTADRVADFWRKKGVNLPNVRVIYVPQVPKGNCYVLADNEWMLVQGSQNLGNGTIVVSDVSGPSTTQAERDLVVKHELGHSREDMGGQKWLPNMEAVADCYAGVSSQDMDRAGIQQYLDALGRAPNGGWHGLAEQRQAYLLYGYEHNNCDPVVRGGIGQRIAG